MALFPSLQLIETRIDRGVLHISVRNAGSATIRTRTYGTPEYRLIAKLFDGEREVQDRWLSLPCDLRPGESAAIAFPLIGEGTTLRLYHAMQDIPMLEPEAFEVARVR